jgi:hypothetical protein
MYISHISYIYNLFQISNLHVLLGKNEIINKRTFKAYYMDE